MAIYDQSYAPWSGAYASRVSRVWALVRPGLFQPFRNIWTLLVVILAFVIAAAWVLVLFTAASRPIPKVFALGNNLYRVNFYNTLGFSIILAVLSATVGASMVSRDLRHNAHLMYFSRAITRGDYLLAKFLTLGGILLFVSLGSGLLLFAGQLAAGLEELTMGQQLRDLGAITLHSMVLSLPMAAVVLACSSLTKRTYVAGILWSAIFLLSILYSDFLHTHLNQEWCKLISWTNLTSHLGNQFYQDRGPAGAVEPVLACGWLEPLLILGGVTTASLGLVRWRLRTLGAGE